MGTTFKVKIITFMVDRHTGVILIVIRPITCIGNAKGNLSRELVYDNKDIDLNPNKYEV